MNQDPLDPKVLPENDYHPSEKEMQFVGDVYQDFFRWRTYRSGSFRQFQNYSLEGMLRVSRELFWNAINTESEDLAALGLQFNIPFTRKEVMEYVGRISSLGVKPRIHGDMIDSYAVKVLDGMYQRWRFKSNDKVEKFWQWLYGTINGTVCLYVGWNNQKKTESFLKNYDPETGFYTLKTLEKEYWNDVETKLVPLEDIYLSKNYERNIQKQGKLIWKSQMEPADFHTEFKMYPDHKYVMAGNRISEDSLYYRLLGGTGVTTLNKVEVLRIYDTDNDQFGIIANGILLNKLGRGKSMKISPMPFDHKMMPFVWAIQEAVDEKLAYGMPLPFKIRDIHKMENTQYVLLLEHMLRVVDPPYLSSDIDSPDIIFGAKKVIPVTDTNAYVPIAVPPVTSEYLTTMNSVQQLMSTVAQGGVNSVIPSIQPKSASEADQANQAKQQALAIPTLMYYDLCRQEILLVLKTMLQFYSAGKFQKEGEDIIKTLMVPNQAMTLGGTGDLEIRFVKKGAKTDQDRLSLYFESIRKASQSGRMTEIIEAPVDLIQNLEFEISDIELEPEQTSEMKKAIFTSSFLVPLIQNWGQTGLIDPAKTLLRFLEKFEEHPLDYVSNQGMPSVMGTWKSMNTFPQSAGTGVNRNTTGGAQAQSPVGQAFGGQSQGGQGQGASPAQQNQFAQNNQ